MRRFGTVAATGAAVMMAGAMLLPAAFAQTAAGARPNDTLTYAQPLAPDAVKEVQQRLRQVGAYSGAVDGVWGRESQTALEHFQQSRGLQVTGQLNQATVATLGMKPGDLLTAGQGAASGSSTPAPPPQRAAGAEPLSPGVVRAIQGRLRQTGFYSGAADGVWGPGTQSALERFQQSRGLQATGQLNPSTIAAMGLNPNDLAAESRGAPSAGASGSGSPGR